MISQLFHEIPWCIEGEVDDGIVPSRANTGVTFYDSSIMCLVIPGRASWNCRTDSERLAINIWNIRSNLFINHIEIHWNFTRWFTRTLTIYMFAGVDFDALTKGKWYRIEGRPVVFLCWMQDSNQNLWKRISVDIYIYIYTYISPCTFPSANIRHSKI